MPPPVCGGRPGRTPLRGRRLVNGDGRASLPHACGIRLLAWAMHSPCFTTHAIASAPIEPLHTACGCARSHSLSSPDASRASASVKPGSWPVPRRIARSTTSTVRPSAPTGAGCGRPALLRVGAGRRVRRPGSPAHPMRRPRRGSRSRPRSRRHWSTWAARAWCAASVRASSAFTARARMVSRALRALVLSVSASVISVRHVRGASFS